MLISIAVPFKRISLENGEKALLTVTTKNISEVMQELVATNNLTVEELAILVIGQLKLCDRENLPHVLPEPVMKKLVSTYNTIKEG